MSLPKSLPIFDLDPTLKPVEGQIWDRVNGYKWWKGELEKNEGGVEKFAEGYKIFGFVRVQDGYTYREWLPNAKSVFLIGEFNNWTNDTPLKSEGFGRWCVTIPDKADGSSGIPHECQIKVRVETPEGEWHDRVPAWIKLARQDMKTMLFNGVFWEPPPADRYVRIHPRPPAPDSLKIYEAHVGMASFEPKVASYLEFARDVIPRIARLGYNCIQLMAIAEHAHYGCFGYHVTSFFAPASRSGTPEELKQMIDVAHGFGIQVLVDLVHAHASSNSLDGIAQMDGTDHCYTHGGPKGHHADWDSKIFHCTKYEVMRFLLSNVRWWLEEYGFDGFRFDGVTSMLYHSHGIGKGYTGGYHEYFGDDADIDNHVYLMLANDVIHSLVPSAVTVGEDVSGMPTLCRPVEDGGFGFDYRLAMAVPDMFIKLLKECDDDGWDMGHITHTLTNRRYKEKVIAYAESHDQAIVGDKTIAFWLMDAEMYTGMSLFQNPQHSLCVDRGLALHKMIRLLVLGLGGEGYLNFIGNEFGHPEWVDFPTELNGGSYSHCRRRWDLADDDLLRYKFFQAFDVMMNACENRFKWMFSEHQYVVIKNEGDKVIAFERGDLLFVFNFHHSQSYEGYCVGSGFNEPMRLVLDSDESRFGGHARLQKNCLFPVGPALQERKHSVKMYLPSRCCQVLAKDSSCQGGVRIWIGNDFLIGVGFKKTDKFELQLMEEQKQKAITDPLAFKATEKPIAFANGLAHLKEANGVHFKLLVNGKDVPCATEKDGLFHVYFGGEYTIMGLGYMKPGKNLERRGTVDADITSTANRAVDGTPAGKKIPATATPKPAAKTAPAAPAAGVKTAPAAPAARAAPAAGGYNAAAAPVAPVNEKDLTGQWTDIRRNVVEIKDLRVTFHDGTKGELSNISDKKFHYKLRLCGKDHFAEQMPGKLLWNDGDVWQVHTAQAQAEGALSTTDARSEGSLSFANLPDFIPEAGPGAINMQRVMSLSALDGLLSNEDSVALRDRDESVTEDDRPARYGARHLSTPVVIAASEMNPFSKTGGLGMVAGSYGYEFAMRGHRTMALVPRYDEYVGAVWVGSTMVWLNGQEHEVGFFHKREDYGSGRGCDFVFVDHDCFRRGGAGIYGDANTGKEYEDNLFRYAMFSIAALEAPLVLKLNGSTYGQDVMFIANDWQTGLLPAYLLYKYKRNKTYVKARTMFVIHNLGFQGKYKKSKFPCDTFLGLPMEAMNELQGEDLNDQDDCLNLLQAGIKISDRVLTVSPNYAHEIQTPEGGHGMDGELKNKAAMLRLAGILNGISDEWNPRTDPHIAINYGPDSFLAGKAKCKAALQKELGLNPDPNACLIGFCGRLSPQKGVHMICESIGWLMKDEGNGVTGRCQLIMMGKGDRDYASQMQEGESQNKGKVCGYVGFDPRVEHRMLAGCDILLMPSQFEPCGLPQMYAQQYATIPVVHETGGLKDSVKGLWDTQRDRVNATGWLFGKFDINSMKEKLYAAMNAYHHDKPLFQQMQTNAVKSDYYWPRALDEYERHIDWTLEDPPCR